MCLSHDNFIKIVFLYILRILYIPRKSHDFGKARTLELLAARLKTYGKCGGFVFFKKRLVRLYWLYSFSVFYQRPRHRQCLNIKIFELAKQNTGRK